jgi:hypothetical protein
MDKVGSGSVSLPLLRELRGDGVCGASRQSIRDVIKRTGTQSEKIKTPSFVMTSGY